VSLVRVLHAQESVQGTLFQRHKDFDWALALSLKEMRSMSDKKEPTKGKSFEKKVEELYGSAGAKKKT